MNVFTRVLILFAAIQAIDGRPENMTERAEKDSKKSRKGATFEWTEERSFQYYLEQKKVFSSARTDAFVRFDQTVVALAAGAVALSITFLEVTPEAVPSEILYLSWVLCILAILFVLASLQLSIKAHESQGRALERCVRTGRLDSSITTRWNRAVSFVNWSAILSVVFGVAGLVWFAATQAR